MESKTLKNLFREEITTLTEYESKKVLREYDIPCPSEFLIEETENIEDYLSDFRMREKDLSYPIYLKVSSRDILHKTDAGAIAQADSDEELIEKGKNILQNAREYDENAEIQGILLSEDVSSPENRELFIGSMVDDQFGNMISFGIGGIAIEVYEDVEFRAVPLEEKDVYNMIKDLKGKKILEEFRGKPPVDIEELVNTILNFSNLIQENKEIAEMDVNPLFAGPSGTVAGDALIKISE